MRNIRSIVGLTIIISEAACLLGFMTACQTQEHSSSPVSSQPAPGATQPSAAPSADAALPAQSVIRIKAGSSAPLTDSVGHVWQPEQGFEGGSAIDRDPSTSIANTKDPN